MYTFDLLNSIMNEERNENYSLYKQLEMEDLLIKSMRANRKGIAILLAILCNIPTKE